MARQVKVDRNNPVSGAEESSSTNGATRPMFGKRNTHKPIKAIVGIVVLLVLSFILYELKGRQEHQPRTPPDSQLDTIPSK